MVGQISDGRSSLVINEVILAVRSHVVDGLALHPFAPVLLSLDCQNAVAVSDALASIMPVAVFVAISVEVDEVTSAILATVSATTIKDGSNRLAQQMPLEVITCPFVMAMAPLTSRGRRVVSTKDGPSSIVEAKVPEVVVRGNVAQEVRRVGHVKVVQAFRMVFSFHRRLSTIFLE